MNENYENVKPIMRSDEPVISMIRVGGYYHWDWKFPFCHWVEEAVIIGTGTEVYQWIQE